MSALAVFGCLASVGCHHREVPAPVPAMRVGLIVSATPGDLPAVRQARAGIRRLRTDLDAVGWVRVVHSEHGGRLALRAAGRAKEQLIFCLGPGFSDTLYEEAVAYPGSWYVLIPGKITGPNIASIDFATGEPGYLAGVAAGAVPHRRGGAAGIIREGGQDLFFARAERGFIKGFETAVRGGRVLVADGPSGIAALKSAGVRVALDTSETTDPAVVAACRKTGILLVTADPKLVTEFPNVVLGTLNIDIGEAMSRVAQEVWAGTMTAKLYRFDLGSGVVGFTLNHFNAVADAPRVHDAVEKAKADVTAGIVEIEELGWSVAGTR